MRNRTGVGDLVASVTKAVGFKPCLRCKETQAKLNEWSRKYARYVPERLRGRLGLTLTKESA